MHRTDAPGHASNQFSEGDPYASPATGGSVVGADWLNDVQENLAQAIEGSGLALVKGDGGQLLAAIRRFVSENYYRGRELRGSVRPVSGTLDVFGIAAPTEAGTATAGASNADGPYRQIATATPSTTPEDIGWVWSYDVVQRRWGWDLEFTWEAGVATNSRVWLGCFSASPMALQDPASISCAGLRFDTTLDAIAVGGDGCWKSCTSNGTLSTVKSTGVLFSSLQRWRVRIRVPADALTKVEFYLDGILVATHDSGAGETVAAASTNLGPHFGLRHLSDTSSKNIRLGWFVLRSK